MIKQLVSSITVTEIICVAGLILFGGWLLKTSFGRKALADSVPRRNNMPLYLPFIPVLIWFGPVPLAIAITRKAFADLLDWQIAFLDNLILCIGATVAMAVIILLARASFARRLKGFGLNAKTIVKDFFAGAVNLLSVWPLVMAMIILTLFSGRLIWGQDFQIEQHEELKIMTAHSQLLVRVLIIVTAVAVVPAFEELLFRGLFQTMIRSFLASRFSTHQRWISTNTRRWRVDSRKGAWLAIVISSGIFAVFHQESAHWPALFVLAMCLGYAYEKSGSLFRPIFIHSFFNAISIISVLRGA